MRLRSALLPLTILVASCGSDEPPAPAASRATTEEVTKVVETFLDAVAAGDGVTACRQLDGGAQEQILDYVRGYRSRGDGCPEGVLLLDAAAGAPVVDRFTSADVGRVTQREREAGFVLTGPGLETPTSGRAIRTGGTWRISDVPGL